MCQVESVTRCCWRDGAVSSAVCSRLVCSSESGFAHSSHCPISCCLLGSVPSVSPRILADPTLLDSVPLSAHAPRSLGKQLPQSQADLPQETHSQTCGLFAAGPAEAESLAPDLSGPQAKFSISFVYIQTHISRGAK